MSIVRTNREGEPTSGTSGQLTLSFSVKKREREAAIGLFADRRLPGLEERGIAGVSDLDVPE